MFGGRCRKAILEEGAGKRYWRKVPESDVWRKVPESDARSVLGEETGGRLGDGPREGLKETLSLRTTVICRSNGTNNSGSQDGMGAGQGVGAGGRGELRRTRGLEIGVGGQ